jgi:2-dehydro-3-deoxyphosphogluconate aldolase/(4S)-4-hydroxy-2-oxoglutarate aldolase
MLNGKLMQTDQSLREAVVAQVKGCGILPCIKLKRPADYLAYAQAMYDGGARVIEVTLTSPGALQAIEAISNEFKGRLWVASGTTLDAASALEVIRHGGACLVNPAVIPEVIDVAKRNGVAVFSGAFTPTEVLAAMRAGADMVKIFPGQLGGPGYMTNLKMVYPQADLIPSGGVSLENAPEFIRAGACAVSGARTFMNHEMIEKEGLGWITQHVRRFIEVIRQARKNLPELP